MTSQEWLEQNRNDPEFMKQRADFEACKLSSRVNWAIYLLLKIKEVHEESREELEEYRAAERERNEP